MSNLKLVPDSPTPLESLLLDASRAEAPSSEHKARLRAALGLGMPLSGPFVAPPPAAAPAPLQPAAAAAGKSLTAVKVAVGVAGLALVGALVLTFQGPAASPPVTAVAPARVVVPPAPPRATESAEELAVSPLPPVEEPATESAPRPARGSAAPAPSAELSEQIRLIEAARAGVVGRDAKSALAALDSYAAKYPRGAFGQEATVLRIRALDQSGDSARATALAKSFVARFPQSPHVARLKPIAERGGSR